MRRCSAGALCATLALAACTDRPRPSPLDPAVGLTVEIVSPSDGSSVYPRFVHIAVHGHDAVGRLNGVGVLVRRSPEGTFVDSVVTGFQPTDDRTATLRVQVQALAKPYGIDLIGLAFNATGGATRTTARSLAVLPCPSTGCPDTTSVGRPPATSGLAPGSSAARPLP